MNPLYPVARRRAGPTARNKPGRGTVLPGFWQVPFYGGLGLLMIVIGTVGRGYALPTLFVGTVLVAGALVIGVRRRRPRLLLLIDFWLLGFVYLFSSELAIESGDVLRDFGIVLSSARVFAFLAGSDRGRTSLTIRQFPWFCRRPASGARIVSGYGKMRLVRQVLAKPEPCPPARLWCLGPK